MPRSARWSKSFAPPWTLRLRWSRTKSSSPWWRADTDTPTIRVQASTGPRLVSASLVWPLAVHEAVGGEGWTISHVPTGLQVIGRLLFRWEAVRVAQALVAEGGDRWLGKDPGSDPVLRELAAGVRERVMAGEFRTGRDLDAVLADLQTIMEEEDG